MAVNFSDIKEVDWVLENNKTISLLKKDNASLIVSFLHYFFKSKNKSSYLSNDLISHLSDFLYRINQEKERFPKDAKFYLENWTKDGFLRQYYDKEDALFELTPATENALRWLAELNKPEFVGTESRLMQIINLLKELTIKSSDNVDLRRNELVKEKEKLEQELLKIEKGEYEKYDKRKIVEQFLLLEEIVGKLLSDFRQIEENFRTLNVKAREDQIKKNLSKGKYLDEVFRTQDLIMETDQGKSFNAFYEFLMNPNRQEDLESLIVQILSLEELRDYQRNNQLELLKENLIDSGERVNKTTRVLIDQLRKYLSSQAYLENRRIAEIISDIEKTALEIKNNAPSEKDFLLLDDKTTLSFPIEQSLWEPTKRVKLSNVEIEEADDDVQIDALFDQEFINPEVLKDRIKRALRDKAQVSLKDIIMENPIEKGLAEIITYFSLATQDEKKNKAVINENNKEQLSYEINGKIFQIELPQTIYLK
ncbi:MAG: DUF3375 domain-containing protein [Bacteroidota bacterium]|nr:DUF3375 domain-containing protein [Bacteroidota bacterium]